MKLINQKEGERGMLYPGRGRIIEPGIIENRYARNFHVAIA
jgi:hypothetical protein